MVELPQLQNMFQGYDFSGIFNKFYAIGKIGISFAILGLVLWYVLTKLHILKPSIRVLIKEKNGVKIDVGRKLKVKGGATKLFLTKEKVNIPYPDPNHLEPLKKPLGMTYLYTVRKVGEGQFNPMVYGNPNDKIEVMSENTKSWMLNELEEAHNIYLKTQSFFEKYQTIISISILGSLFLIMVIFSLGYMEQVVAALNNLVSKMVAIQTIN